jgi:peptidoglycan/LPS O-acetylase OafA/YrhL
MLPGQLIYFLSGAFLYFYYDMLRSRILWLLPAGLVLFSTGHQFGLAILSPIGLGLLVFLVAFGPFLGNFGRFGDFSYGIYIIHFPIIQTLIFARMFNSAPYTACVLAYVFALVTAVLSWQFIEKPWLLRSSHYVEATSADTVAA